MTTMKQTLKFIIFTALVARYAFASFTGTVDTSGSPLNVRSTPDTTLDPIGSISNGATITIDCQTHGETVEGGTYGTTDIWDYVSSEGGYVSDSYVHTGHDWVGPECGGEETSTSSQDVVDFVSSGGSSGDGGFTGTVDTAGSPLQVRWTPDTTLDPMGEIPDGTAVTITCQVYGETVEGGTYGTSYIWDYVPSVDGFVSDAYVYTGSDWIGPDCADPIPEPQPDQTYDDGQVIPLGPSILDVAECAWALAKNFSAFNIIRKYGGIKKVAELIFQTRDPTEFAKNFPALAKLILNVPEIMEKCFGITI